MTAPEPAQQSPWPSFMAIDNATLAQMIADYHAAEVKRREAQTQKGAA